jgi:alpha-amylase
LALIGDDGEKFGGWPRTREWLYDQGWLEDFGQRMDALRADGTVRWVTPADALAEIPATGPVYLPSGSYPEMEGWALGGHWKGFLSRYPEANRIHKRMIALSRMSRERGDPTEVRRALGRAQCNDAYWHGVFGGLYMKHLREGVRRELMDAERGLRADESFGCTRLDVDGDGADEWWVHGPAVSAWIDPRGMVTDLLWLEGRVDVLDVLTRYREEYHLDALRRDALAGSSAEGDAAPSIHDIEEAATLDRLPPEDGATRVLVRERVLAADQGFEGYAEAEFEPVWCDGDFTIVEGPAEAGSGSEGMTWVFRTSTAPIVEKTLSLREDGTLTYEWRWTASDFRPDGRFAPEISLGADAELRLFPEVDVWRYPIVTTSKCPDGFEEIEQGTSITPLWPLDMERARVELRPPTKRADPAT